MKLAIFAASKAAVLLRRSNSAPAIKGYKVGLISLVHSVCKWLLHRAEAVSGKDEVLEKNASTYLTPTRSLGRRKDPTRKHLPNAQA
jgi:hypothetical protein